MSKLAGLLLQSCKLRLASHSPQSSTSVQQGDVTSLACTILSPMLGSFLPAEPLLEPSKLLSCTTNVNNLHKLHHEMKLWAVNATQHCAKSGHNTHRQPMLKES